MSDQNSYEKRFARHISLKGFGAEAQEKLKNSKVTVVGCGGLGCPALLYLAANGIGSLKLIDADVVQISNLHRQILFDTDDIGEYKVEAAASRLRAINPDCEIETVKDYLRLSNAMELLKGSDIVIDGSDNFPTRYLVNDACYLLGIPLVYGAVNEFEGQVSLFNVPSESDPSPNYRDLFPNPPQSGIIRNCAEAGVIGVLPGIIGQWQASEAIKYLSGVGETLKGKLLLFDFLTNTTTQIKFRRNPKIEIVELVNIEHESCTDEEVSWLDLTDVLTKKNAILIDVREPHEHQECNAGGRNAPLSRLAELDDFFDQDRTFVLYCQTGNRSSQALNSLKAKNLKGRYFHIKNGIKAYPFC